MKDQNKFYVTFVDHGKLYFRILEGAFKDVEFSYKSMLLNGKLDYQIKSHKSSINESNKILFENEIRGILRDKLASLKS